MRYNELLTEYVEQKVAWKENKNIVHLEIGEPVTLKSSSPLTGKLKEVGDDYVCLVFDTDKLYRYYPISRIYLIRKPE